MKRLFIFKFDVLFACCCTISTISIAQTPHIVYSTFLGGKSSDYGHSITVDSKGCVYMAGQTSSSDFPTTSGSFDPTANGDADIFISKLDETGSNLVFSSFVGGSSFDDTRAITIDTLGNVYLTGSTQSSNFPSSTSTLYTTSKKGYFSKLNAEGSKLDICGRWLEGSKIVFDSEGYAIIFGSTSQTNLPVTSVSYNSTANGNADIFVAKIDLEHDSLLFATYLGGSGNDYCYGGTLALDSANNIIVAGYTLSSDFPVKGNCFGSYTEGKSNLFVTKLKADGSGLLFSTLIGGAGNEYLMGMVTDVSENIYLSGMTYSTDYPTTQSAFDTISNSAVSGFLTKLSADGSQLVYSTYIGGSSKSSCRGLAIDEEGKVYVTGTTLSTDFPVTENALYGSYSGCVSCDEYGWGDSFFLIMNPEGSKLEYATYLGGPNDEEAYDLVMGVDGSVYLTGCTISSAFPTTARAFQRTKKGGLDVYVTKLSFDSSSLKMSLSSDSLQIGWAASSTAFFTIESNTGWNISSSASWLTPSRTIGANSDTITLTATENSSVSPRTATLTITGGGTSTKTLVVTQEAKGTGIGSIENRSIKFYPNPTEGKVTFSLGDSLVKETVVTVFNSEGKLMKSNNYSRLSTATVDLADLPSGVYSVKLTIGGRSFVSNVVKQ